MSGDRERTESRSRTDTASVNTMTTPGTAFGQNILTGIENSGMMDQIGNVGSGYQGDLTDANQPVLNDYVGTWGNAPSTFITQQTATGSPLDIDETYVDTNYDPGIEAGLDAAGAMSGNLSGLSLAGLNWWNDRMLHATQNPMMQAMLDQLQTEHSESAAQNQNAYAATMGQQGAFGGTDYDRGSAWMAEQQQQEFDQAASKLLWDDWVLQNQMMLQAPENIAGFAGIGTLPAEQMLHYGGLRQQNLQEAQQLADTNAQGQANNAWQQLQLGDTNRQRAADDAIAAWEAAHTISQADAANAVAQQDVRNRNRQAELDNDYARWASQGDALQNQLNQLQQLVNIGASVPGMTSTSRGASRNNTTSSTSQQESPWSVISGILGAIMGGMGGGFGGGGGGGTGGGGG